MTSTITHEMLTPLKCIILMIDDFKNFTTSEEGLKKLKIMQVAQQLILSQI